MGDSRGSRGNAPPILFLVLPKRERAAPGPREKNAAAGRSARGAYLRPPAGDGWPFLVVVLIKRVPLGETFGPGRARIPPASLSAGAGLAVGESLVGRQTLRCAAGNRRCPGSVGADLCVRPLALGLYDWPAARP